MFFDERTITDEREGGFERERKREEEGGASFRSAETAEGASKRIKTCGDRAVNRMSTGMTEVLVSRSQGEL